MLIIFALAALALVAAFAIVFGLPIMIAVAMVRRRRRRLEQVVEPRPGDAFVELVSREWPQEAQVL